MKKIIFALMALMLQAGYGQEWKSEGLWHNVGGGARVWLVAKEEADFIKGKIGQWLPIEVIKTEGDAGFLWKIEKLERKSNKLDIKLMLDLGKEKKYYQISNFDKGPDGELTAVVLLEKDEVRVRIKCGDGSTRDILFGSAANLVDLRGKYVVSKAMPLWDWDKAQVIEAGGP